MTALLATLHRRISIHTEANLLLVTAISGFAQTKALQPVAQRLAEQNALFGEQYESNLREFPQRATDLGDYRYNDKLTGHSLAALLRREKSNESFLLRL